MQVYRATLELLDYVFYATVERGKVYETGSFVHNYALAYALGLVHAPTYTYAHLEQVPRYREELAPLNGRIYLTPAKPVHVSHRLIQWNTIREGYALPGKPPSLGYPDWGFARLLRAESRFTFYLLLPGDAPVPEAPALSDLMAGRAVRVRLGKFPGKVRLSAEQAQAVTQLDGPFETEEYLNWQDLEVDPVACDIVATSLPTRLLAAAAFAAVSHYEARFPDGAVCLPAGMRFLARTPKEGA